ncbi:hypothetical protein ACKA06_21000 [Rossellomorea oryzaecorticis]|uniref:Uncharacterized protein n=1 Tax=Rossellomorea oryzaecorticis TaxID=1396505 RepID=A0ABW8VXB5_9BACI
MKNKRRLTFLLIIIVTAAFFGYQYVMNDEVALSKDHEKILSSHIDSIEQTVKSDITRNTQDFLTFPVEDSKDEFTTLYTYFSLDLLGPPPGQQVCNQFSNELAKEEFTQTEETFYTGIERLYYAVKLIDLCDQEQLTGETEARAEEAIRELYSQTFFKEGYFLSNEFKEYRNKEGYEEVKLMQTSMMLELAQRADVDLSRNKEAVTKWLKGFMEGKTDALSIRHYSKIMKLLNTEPSSSIMNKISYKSIVQKDFYEFTDLLTIESLTHLHKEQQVTLKPEDIQAILQRISYSHNQFANIQQEFYVISIYSNLDMLDAYPNKDKLTRQFERYVHSDGMMPVFSKTNNPYSPYYSMVVAMQSADKDDVAAIQLNKFLAGFLKETDMDELTGLDPFEILSYIHLKKHIDEGFQDTDEAAELAETLKQKLPSQVNAGNVIRTSYLIDSLTLLQADVKEEDFPGNTLEILKRLGSGKTKLFENSTDFSNILFVNSLAGTGKFSKELKDIVPYVEKVNIDTKSEVAAYELYQKALFLRKMGVPTDDNLIAEKLIQLQNGSGYKLNNKQQYKNFYATIFLNRLNQSLLGEEQIDE